MRVAFIASEIAPFSKTGGLADVAGALPPALEKLGAEVITVSPLHRSVRAARTEPTPHRVRVPLGSGAVEAAVRRSGRNYFLEHDGYFDRDGLYGSGGGDYGDNASRFILLARGALDLVARLGGADLVHAHDWQAGLVPVYLKTLHQADLPDAKSVFTVHNLAYQGNFWHLDMPLTGLDWTHFNWRELEFHGRLSFLKAGLVYADAITTVSPTYAREIRSPESGYGMDGVLRDRAEVLHGILNGIDAAEWDPSADRAIAAPYSARDLGGKARCKAALQEELGLAVDPKTPLAGFVGRLAWQKGMDLVVQAADAMLDAPCQLVVLGTGEPHYQEAFRRLAERRPDRVAARIRFDDALAHRIEAACDLFLMPSRYEPCGLNQMYSLRYGTVPVVRATGGLADTVEDGVTGFTFGPFSAEALLGAFRRALARRSDPAAWTAMLREGMARDFSWQASARRYFELYRSLLG